MAKELALPEGIADHCAIRIVSTPVFRRKDGRLADPEPVILSSLIVPDLQRVQEAGVDDFGAALASYLGEPLRPSERVDLAADRAALLDGVRPSAFPLARWPADTASALTTSQQFAVNTIMAELGGKRGRGLFAVNGPPGTGKTTLLRDLIAAIITARAEALAGLKEPGDAFTKDGSVWRPKRELTGFEIVVTSSNNAAVENVTTELPTLNAIGDEWHGLANYLGEQAVAYLGPDAWGTIAVPLGKSENRLRFRDKLWFADGGLYQFLRARARERNGILGAGAQDEAWSAAVKAFKKARREASRLAARLRKQESLDGNAGLGGVGPERWAELSQDEQELAAPWSDEEWTRARTEVFLAALDLHAAFVAGAADQLLANMERVLRVLAGDPDAKKSEDLQALWQTLFLLVPVISTTFASCGRMFGALGPESLGWLLIDEAGQALPQAAVGALWRSRRAVVVGDPMQLRPISQVPEEVQERLRGMFGPVGGAGIDARWQPSEVSAQALADRRNTWGAEIHGPGGEVWVGAPLRVHRRCQEPMFGISNAISYGGLMVYGTQEQPFPGSGYPEYPRSSWVDVTGLSAGKWVPAQGDALLAVLRRLRDRGGIGLNQVYVLSPFREVVFRCRPLARQQLLGDGLPENAARDFTQNRIGTVHTTQGKEADVVILVLGADSNPRKRARDWAADPANLLNVAVSRARRRLFVIGDRADWSAAPNFSALAERLPRVRWPG